MKPLPKGLLISGIVLCVGGPLAGVVLTAIGMVGAFQTLGDNGISDPNGLSAHIGSVLIATEIGFVAALLGMILIAAAVIAHFTGKKV